MAGWARVGAALRRWWAAPATLSVLVDGRQEYGRALGQAWTRLALLGTPVGLSALLIEGSLSARTVVGTLVLMVFLALCISLFRHVTTLPDRVVGLALMFGAGLLGFWIALLGPEAGESAALVPVAAAMCSIWMARRWAILSASVGAATYAVSLLARDIDNPGPRWFLVVGLAVLVVIEMSWMLDRVHDLAEQERAASAENQRLAVAEQRAREELAELNRTLEERVAAQVGEIEGLGRLRKFLAPQVADAIVSAESLAPHRRQIAVVFCDLRGFTSFSNSSEPEELLEVLQEYYEVVGSRIREYEATLGSFQGDGILAYFNDPIPCDDPAGQAIAMALSLREPLQELSERWSRRGFELGYGMGIAFGYATLGTVGFEDRLDYTPLGAVVNMASRLGDEADWGEILIDGRAMHVMEGRLEAEQVELQLKGFRGSVPAYRLGA